MLQGSITPRAQLREQQLNGGVPGRLKPPPLFVPTTTRSPQLTCPENTPALRPCPPSAEFLKAFQFLHVGLNQITKKMHSKQNFILHYVPILPANSLTATTLC